MATCGWSLTHSYSERLSRCIFNISVPYKCIAKAEEERKLEARLELAITWLLFGSLGEDGLITHIELVQSVGRSQ